MNRIRLSMYELLIYIWALLCRDAVELWTVPDWHILILYCCSRKINSVLKQNERVQTEFYTNLPRVIVGETIWNIMCTFFDLRMKMQTSRILFAFLSKSLHDHQNLISYSLIFRKIQSATYLRVIWKVLKNIKNRKFIKDLKSTYERF